MHIYRRWLSAVQTVTDSAYSPRRADRFLCICLPCHRRDYRLYTKLVNAREARGSRKLGVGKYIPTRWVGYEEPEVPGSRDMALLIRASSVRGFLKGVWTFQIDPSFAKNRFPGPAPKWWVGLFASCPVIHKSTHSWTSAWCLAKLVIYTARGNGIISQGLWRMLLGFW